MFLKVEQQQGMTLSALRSAHVESPAERGPFHQHRVPVTISCIERPQSRAGSPAFVSVFRSSFSDTASSPVREEKRYLLFFTALPGPTGNRTQITGKKMDEQLQNPMY